MTVTLDDRPNHAYSTLAAAITIGQTTGVQITDPARFPVPVNGYEATLFLAGEDTAAEDDTHERIRITGKPSNYSIDRAQAGTTAKAWPAGTKIVVGPGKKVFDDIEELFQKLVFGTSNRTSVLIDGVGAISKTAAVHVVQSAGGAGVDDNLDTINGGTQSGEPLLVTPYYSTGTISLRDVGNIDPGDESIVLGWHDYALLLYNLSSTTWEVVFVGRNVHMWDPGLTNPTSEMQTKRQVCLYEDAVGANFQGSTRLSVETDDTTPVSLNRIGVAATGSHTMIAFRVDDVLEGTIAYDADTDLIDYNSFLGSHLSQFKPGVRVPPTGGVVIGTGEAIESRIEYWEVMTTLRYRDREAGEWRERVRLRKVFLPGDVETPPPGGVWISRASARGPLARRFQYSEPSASRRDPRVSGVILGGPSGIDPAASTMGRPDLPLYNIAAKGKAVVRVTDTGGDIVNGDFLCSSAQPWLAERQDDDVKHNYTFAKAREDVVWADVEADPELGFKWALIAATLEADA